MAVAQGGTALEAADGIHTDLARGFIRAEVMTVTDLVRLGSEREREGPAPHASGAEGLRRQGRRYSVDPVQCVTCFRGRVPNYRPPMAIRPITSTAS